MYLVDTSVGIDFIRGKPGTALEQLYAILKTEQTAGISPVIYQEILQRSESEQRFKQFRDYFKELIFYHPKDLTDSHAQAAYLNFSCRRRGITIRSTVDCLIAQTAIEHNLILLHSDKDFLRIAEVTPLLHLYPDGNHGVKGLSANGTGYLDAGLDALKTQQTSANKIKQANAQETDPDFIFALSHQDGYERLMVLETEGDHLDNPDTAYKKKLFYVCSESFRLETIKSAGELELLDDKGVKVSCSLIFENTWQTDLAKLIEDSVQLGGVEIADTTISVQKWQWLKGASRVVYFNS